MWADTCIRHRCSCSKIVRKLYTMLQTGRSNSDVDEVWCVKLMSILSENSPIEKRSLTAAQKLSWNKINVRTERRTTTLPGVQRVPAHWEMAHSSTRWLRCIRVSYLSLLVLGNCCRPLIDMWQKCSVLLTFPHFDGECTNPQLRAHHLNCCRHRDCHWAKTFIKARNVQWHQSSFAVFFL